MKEKKTSIKHQKQNISVCKESGDKCYFHGKSLSMKVLFGYGQIASRLRWISSQ